MSVNSSSKSPSLHADRALRRFYFSIALYGLAFVFALIQGQLGERNAVLGFIIGLCFFVGVGMNFRGVFESVKSIQAKEQALFKQVVGLAGNAVFGGLFLLVVFLGKVSLF